ncbi:peptidoglycan DD-metalloendopeptidase family protein [Nocardia vermiculata]|uniref:Peptidoglycan DD-metalloendopeptidase family protein n=1 Tax=Nocardia vermiculata TaxID=257274 RepID=A0A846YB09_9NOCA|nr:peptidoglycan DD-metalloendopeptidase family protein [Nocardia vermiculata]NKY53959.1 peptidoglycan DD-metalloendopeptidase family protein [Nocardia vermiculata]
MTAAAVVLVRHWRKILAVLLLLLLLLAKCAAEQNNTACGTNTGPTTVNGPLAYPLDPSVEIGSGYRSSDRPNHRGVDFPVPEGSPIYAFADGTVTAAQDTGVQGFSAWIVISHVIDGKPMSTVYGHMNPGGVLVKVGDQVTAGQLIARSGNSGQSSGPHLHFEIWNGDRLAGGTDTDPTPYLQQARQAASGGASQTLNANQRAAAASSATDRNAAIVIATGKQMGAPDEAIVSALAVGLVESGGLKNLASDAVPESKNYPHDGVAPGDSDSVGIMQQQYTQGWGSVKDLMNPAFQARNYYTRFLASDWQHKSFTEAAADIQRPREDLRGKYGEREADARALFARLQGVAPSGAPGGCTPGGHAPGGPTTPGDPDGGAAIVAAARSQIGQPYVWGGGDTNGPTGGGFDCSGLTMYAIAQATHGSVSLPHYTGDTSNPGQMGQGQPVSDLSQAQPGDLVFFGSGGTAEHVGVYEGAVNGVPTMIHAPTEGQDVTEAPVADGGQLIAIRRYTNPDNNSRATVAASGTQTTTGVQ